MKRFLYGLFIMFCFIGCVNAESFVEGKFISGEYVDKVKDGVTNYLTMQYIKDDSGNIVYCLEPYVKFNEGDNYSKYEWDLSSYNKLSDEQRRKVELLAYYGYGYTNRTSSKWYVITQVLIWKTIDTKGNIYFTDKLNGKKITKYESEMNELLNDVNNHDVTPNIGTNYTVNYLDDLEVIRLNTNYDIVSSSYDYKLGDSLLLKDVNENGVVEYKRKSNYYKDKIALFVSDNNQDLLRPGNIDNKVYKININVTKGDILLDIRDDHSYYSVESDFSDTCYELYDKNNEVIDKVCTSNEPLIFKTKELPYGEYSIKQVSHGIGYIKDNNIHNVSINDKNSNPTVILHNKLLKNTINITKYACIVDDCIEEKNAKFGVYDKNNKLVDYMVTDSNGKDYLTLGYGTYNVKQISGLDDYTLADDFSFKILDEVSTLEEYLYNYKIIEDKEVKGVVEEPIDTPEEVVELPPDTKITFKAIWDTFKVVLRSICILTKNLIFSCFMV